MCDIGVSADVRHLPNAGAAESDESRADSGINAPTVLYAARVSQAIEVELTHDERAILRWGLRDWGGPASPSEDLVRVMGFESIADLFNEGRRIADLIWTGQPLIARDWTRALVATEFGWASDVYGSGLDSVYTFGYSDAEAVALLRSAQRKLREAGAIRRSSVT